MQKYEILQNCPFSLPFPTVISFHRVKKSPLIIGIVDRIKISSEQPLPFSQSELSIPYFLQIVHINVSYVCFVYFTAIARVCINFHRQHVWSLYRDGVKGETRPTCLRKYREEDAEEAVAKRAIKELEIFVSDTFYNFFYLLLLLLLLLFYHFFSYFFLPTTFTHTHDPHPRPTTSTHNPRPTTFSYTQDQCSY